MAEEPRFHNVTANCETLEHLPAQHEIVYWKMPFVTFTVKSRLEYVRTRLACHVTPSQKKCGRVGSPAQSVIREAKTQFLGIFAVLRYFAQEAGLPQPPQTHTDNTQTFQQQPPQTHTNTET